MRRGLAVVLVALAACGGEREGVVVTEADDDAPVPVAPPPRLDLPLDTVYADAGLFADPSLDSLAADSLGADSLTASGPDFRAFWPRFRDALDGGPEAVAALAALEAASAPLDALVADSVFRPRARALSARDFRRDGTRRDVWIRVGFDRAGNVVPEDEAVTESALRLRFEVADGVYRLVGLETAG